MKRMIVLLMAVLLLTGCTPQEQKVQQNVFCMDTVMSITLWGDGAEAAFARLRDELYELEKTWSATGEDSLLMGLNRGESVTLTSEQQKLLDRTLSLKERTDGAFDPQLHGIVAAWGFPTDEFRLPTAEEIERGRELAQWDLGAAMKGYAGDRLAEILTEFNVDRAVLNLGGNIQTYGAKPDGSPWVVAVQNPDLSEDHLGLLEVTGTMAVVTSGDYQRYFEQNGVRYHHILDPETGFPADSGLASVTVICRDGLTADALSTALFVMGLEEATQFWRQSSDFEAVFVTKNGRIYATEGAVLSDCVFEVIKR